jgi:hypothetical protein
MDDKGGEDDVLKLQLLLSLFLPGQNRKFWVSKSVVPDLCALYHIPCNQFGLAYVDLRTICNMC